MSFRRRLALAAGAALVVPLTAAALPTAPAAAVCPFDRVGITCNPAVSSAVVGYISIQHVATANQPRTFHVYGELSLPDEWTCSDTTLAGGAYKVTCVPATSSNLVSYRCDVLHADAFTTSATATARTSLDCDGSSPAEAQTATVSGAGGADHAWAVSDVVVTEFSCTIDDGAGGAPSPDFTAGCGDPGAVEVR